MDYIFFENWQGIVRTLIITVLAYFSIILLLRVSGKRTLSKMNAFDFIITIALGSTLATVALNKNVPLLEGVLAFVLLIGLQFVFTSLAVRISWFRQAITHRPALLVYKGEMQLQTMKKERITRDEVYQSLRKHGHGDLQDIDAIVLEGTGDLTVISSISEKGIEALENVAGYPRGSGVSGKGQ